VRDGERVWHFRDGKYANPVISDGDRVYVTGRAHEYAFAKPGSKVVKEYLAWARARKRRAEAREARARKAAREKRRRERSRREERRQKQSDRG